MGPNFPRTATFTEWYRASHPGLVEAVVPDVRASLT